MVTELKVKLLSKDGQLPVRAKKGDAGLDLVSAVDMFVPLGTTVSVPLDLAVEIPYGFYGQIHDRSSMAKKGLRTGAGVVDSQFRGNLSVILHNLTNDSEYQYNPENNKYWGYNIRKGDRIAQLVIKQIELPVCIAVEELSSTERGAGAFGSSGR